MARIAELSEDPKYTIKNVAAQTGIRPVTLRAWERRHEVLTPHRSDNRYRLYSERDVAVLRWLKNRIDDGVSISNAVMELRSMTNIDEWPEAIPNAPTQTKAGSNTPPADYAVRLYHALIRHDEATSSDLMREVHAIFDLTTVCTQVIVPALHMIGDAWYRGEIRITTEHFASAYLRGKLLSLLQAYPTRRNTPNILVGCAPMEHHELGSLMLAVMLRSEGYRVEFLGPDIPLEDLADYASFEKPAMVILSASLEDSAQELRNFQTMLKKNKRAPIFAYGGRAFDLNPQLIKQVAGKYLGNTLDLALKNVQALLSPKALAA